MVTSPENPIDPRTNEEHDTQASTPDAVQPDTDAQADVQAEGQVDVQADVQADAQATAQYDLQPDEQQSDKLQPDDPQPDPLTDLFGSTGQAEPLTTPTAATTPLPPTYPMPQAPSALQAPTAPQAPSESQASSGSRAYSEPQSQPQWPAPSPAELSKKRRPLFGTIVWGVLLLVFAAFMVVWTVVPMSPDPTLWLLGAVITTGILLVVAGIVAAARRAG